MIYEIITNKNNKYKSYFEDNLFRIKRENNKLYYEYSYFNVLKKQEIFQIRKITNPEFYKFTQEWNWFYIIFYTIIVQICFSNIFGSDFGTTLFLSFIIAAIGGAFFHTYILRFLFVNSKIMTDKEINDLFNRKDINKNDSHLIEFNMVSDSLETKEKKLTKQERINNAKDEKFNELIDDISEKVKDIEKKDNKIFGSVENKRKTIHAIAKQNLNDNLDWLKEAGYLEKEILKIADDFEIKEQKKLTNHSAYEGRIKSSDKTKIKNALGYNCMACGINMGEKYGKYGENYIELHHKILYSDMQENDERTLNSDDFCVLCPNCHRIIHKLDDAGDIELLKNIIEINKKL